MGVLVRHGGIHKGFCVLDYIACIVELWMCLY
ncbi:hypothetical protein ECH_0349 [Ehrlichia chaffeensis str. Arkansas]|uniref:Uncharacterized protein n=1 Tax=Ehrlichia chaffeensis (strain ATCC CRL-10679 / Arkansas) TaxID=205920 RepID=Q2GHB4_EHRCR|nr:hypothetical protein ECH_0349 [Ehrlichia chaffeensis str. Arkansas]